ncbi:M20/M25/M40 family metallo-hydrolase [Alicyclobacillus vulcanalis]|uniref:Di-or tripeptidase n=1 Tax=Alicyclobacillus vulcanalis TaxID=252246 RepID=A0A1N7KM71_9BACL|nr:M20/M25/M40 family metallo-hydrolase [Alicyclobacillus vulcanalis]SIS62617.1 Di-or tripeptidase [Alicyclobacillus vulcanalis]
MRAGSRVADDESALALFLRLLQIESPTGDERQAAVFCASWAERLGLSVEWEPVAVGDRLSANLWVGVPGDLARDPVLVCAHLDTRHPGLPALRRRTDGWLESGNGVPLGADDKAGVAAILAALTRIVREERPHPPIRVLLSAGEEVGSAGVRSSARARVRGWRAIVVDAESPVGTLVEGGYGRARLRLIYDAQTASHPFTVWRQLQEAIKHLGPGLSAQLLRFDPTDAGACAEFSIWCSPDCAWPLAHSRYQAWAADLVRRTQPRDAESEVLYPSYDVRASFWLLEVKRRLARSAPGLALIRMREGCDANWLASMGATPVNLGVGYEHAHTRAERVHEQSLAQLTRLLLAILTDPRE